VGNDKDALSEVAEVGCEARARNEVAGLQTRLPGPGLPEGSAISEKC
jgi:hypothetical protein